MDEGPTVLHGIAEVDMGILESSAPLKQGPYQAVMDRLLDWYRGTNVIYGGARNKILAATSGKVMAALQHKVGGLWNLCARGVPQAVNEIGSRVDPSVQRCSCRYQKAKR